MTCVTSKCFNDIYRELRNGRGESESGTRLRNPKTGANGLGVPSGRS